MKNLLLKSGKYYLCDDSTVANGKSCIVTNDWVPTKTNMPHKHFKDSIVLYGRYTCPYCIGLVDYLKTKPALYKRLIFVEVDMPDEPLFKKPVLLDILKSEIKMHSTVPIVFDKGKFIGGSDDAKNYFV